MKEFPIRHFNPLITLKACLLAISLAAVSFPIAAQDEGIEINAGLNDAWFNEDTAGQGFFITVFPDIEQMFLAWFTYDVERPDDSVEANLGEPGHRWLTAFGPYKGDTATLEVELTSGGVFDKTDPAPKQDPDGTITVRFSDCENGLLTFDLTASKQQGEIPIARIASDNVPRCESLTASKPVILKYVGNLGVLMQHEDKEVIIDGLLGNIGGWVAPNTAELNNIVNGNAPYEDIEIAGYTHGHGDHVSFTVANNFMANHPNAVFFGASSEGVGSVIPQARVQRVDVPRGQNMQYDVNGIQLTVYHTRHFNQFGNDFSGVTNLAFLVELGGKKILHIGDFDYAADNVAAFGLQPGEIDAIIMPTFNTLISQANMDLITSMLAPTHVIAAHFQTSQLANESNQVLNLVPGAIIFDTAGEEFTLD